MRDPARRIGPIGTSTQLFVAAGLLNLALFGSPSSPRSTDLRRATTSGKT
jgi:hypothetical protein